MPRNSKKAFIKLDRETLQNRKGAGWMSIYLQTVPTKRFVQCLLEIIQFGKLQASTTLQLAVPLFKPLAVFTEVQSSVLL